MQYRTAESVTIGHPDKLADLVADSILDECLKQDADSRVACEVLIAHDTLHIAGEISTAAKISPIEIARRAIKEVGYEPPAHVYTSIAEQSRDIGQAVNKEQQGAGDQGIIYGYATDETISRLPLAADLARRLTGAMSGEAMRSKGYGPDGKAQVTVAYDNAGRFKGIDTVLVSIQHPEAATAPQIGDDVLHGVLQPGLGEFLKITRSIIVNPSGRFVKGGFEADTGLTGRKLAVDTYGGLAHHGGGAMSGKDPSKVDRSAAYMARYIANTIIASGLASVCEVGLAYAIGMAEPVMVSINTFGSATEASDAEIATAVKKAFDLTPRGITRSLGLTKICYTDTVRSGAFGYGKPYPWENVSVQSAIELRRHLSRRG